MPYDIELETVLDMNEIALLYLEHCSLSEAIDNVFERRQHKKRSPPAYFFWDDLGRRLETIARNNNIPLPEGAIPLLPACDPALEGHLQDYLDSFTETTRRPDAIILPL